MSTGRRAYDLLRGYVNSEWERLQGVEQNAAWKELQDATTQTPPADATASPADQVVKAKVPVENQAAYARTVLGVGEQASFEEIRKAFERLSKRSDPANFPAGSQESLQASEIQKRVHWAYGLLTENIDATEKRFRSLEI